MNNLIFNGITKDYLTPLRGSSNREPWAPVERVYQEVPNRPGAYPRKKRKTKPRPLPIPVMIEARSIADLLKMKEDLADWLIQDDPKPLILPWEPDRTYFAFVDGSFNPDDIVNIGQGIIPFICPDPYKYGTEVTVPANEPITNEGTAETWPSIRVTFTMAVSEFKIAHQNGKFVRAIYNFSTGDVLEIDLAKRKALINGIVNMPAYYFRNQPFMLIPGENTLTVEPAGVANVEVTYRPRWK